MCTASFSTIPAADLPSAARASRAIGAMFFAGFGTAWLCWGAALLGGGGLARALVVAAGLGLGAAAWRRFQANRGAREGQGDTPRARRVARVFHGVNAAQWVLILVLANVLDNTGLGDWVPAMIMAIVGLHFLPLAAVFEYRPHYVSGAALILLALVFPFLAAAGPRSGVGPLGAGLILWASAAYALAAPARRAGRIGAP